MILDPDKFPQPRRVRVKIEDDPKVPPVTLIATLIPNIGDVIEFMQVAGTSYRQPALARLACLHSRGPIACVLIPEPTNPYDPRAIGIWTRGGHSGFIPRDSTDQFHGPLAQLEAEHGTAIAIPGEFDAAAWGLSMLVTIPREFSGVDYRWKAQRDDAPDVPDGGPPDIR